MAQAFVNLGVTQAMSPNVGNFVHDLVEMAKAMETLPMREAEIRDLRITLDEAQSHNQGLEQNISNYKQQIEDLQSKVRSLEVERDDAGFRVLEAEDKAHHVLNWARDTQALMGQVINELDPPKPEPEIVQPPGTPPEPNPATFTGFEPKDQNPPDWKQDQAETSRMPQGSSESNPTGEQQAGSQEGLPANTTILSAEDAVSAESQDTAPASTSEPSNPDVEGAKPLGPYFNKRYYDQSEAIPLDQWLAGDGTETDYHWRPSIRYAPEY